MFALFYKLLDGQLKFIVDADNRQLAIYLGKRFSLEKQTPVIGFENGRDGTTHECCRFENGELIREFSTRSAARRCG